MTNPINLSLTSEQKDRAMYITATWDASPSADVDHYLLQFKQTAETAWDSLYVDSSPGVFAVEGGYTYDVRVAAVGTDMTKSGFVRDEVEVDSVNLTIDKGSNTLFVGNATMSGTISTTNGSATVTGSSTAFLTEIAEGDTLIIGNYEKVVDTVTNNSSLTLTTNMTETLSGQNVIVKDVVMLDNLRFFNSALTISKDGFEKQMPGMATKIRPTYYEVPAHETSPNLLSSSEVYLEIIDDDDWHGYLKQQYGIFKDTFGSVFSRIRLIASRKDSPSTTKYANMELHITDTDKLYFNAPALCLSEIALGLKSDQPNGTLAVDSSGDLYFKKSDSWTKLN